MRFPEWLTWKVGAVGGGLLAALGYALATSAKVGPPLAPGATSSGLRRLDGSAPIVPVLGRTYFATVTTHGLANAATIGEILDGAHGEGFADVVIVTKRITGWPGSAEGDYYVRATFRGPRKSAAFARRYSGFGWSVDVADVWESIPG